MEMHHIAAHHIMFLTGINEIVGLRAGIFAGAEESKAVLQHASAVVKTHDDLQAAFEVLGLRQERGTFVTFGIFLRRVHVALAIHHLVIFPVDNRAARHADFEHVGVGTHEVGGHVAAERPAMHAETVSIDIRQGFEKFHALQLVLHLGVAEVAVRAALEVETAILRAAVVDYEQHVAALRHIDFPRAGGEVPAFLHVVGVRAAVNVNHRGVFLGGVEANGLHEAVVEVGRAVGGLDAAARDLGYVEVGPRRGDALLHGLLLAVGGIDKVNLAIGVGLAPTVAKETAAGGERGAVHALAIVEQLAFARSDIDGVEIVAHGRLLVGKIDDALGLLVETEEIDYLKRALGKLRQLLARHVEEIKMVVAIAARLHHELACVPREEDNRVHRLDVPRIGLGV